MPESEPRARPLGLCSVLPAALLAGDSGHVGGGGLGRRPPQAFRVADGAPARKSRLTRKMVFNLYS